ncbi:MAG: hypothetical protein GY750_15650 [Lentisphaerae bacterium]|nr:hypothetical protein [Lentisphaerota bacterium]MCP4102832.1 hypothetical protein [Lentisphaerota bacterium]
MKYIGSLDSSIKEIKDALEGLFSENPSFRNKHVRYKEGAFYLHSGKFSRFGFGYGSDDRRSKQEEGKEKAYELFTRKYPPVYSSRFPRFSFNVIDQQFRILRRRNLLLAGEFYNICNVYLRDYDRYIPDSFKAECEHVLNEMFKIYSACDAFVFGHKHTEEKSSGHSFIRDFFVFLRDLKNINISQGHVVFYEILVSLHSHYRRRALSNYDLEENYEFNPDETYKNPNSLIQHLDALRGDRNHHKVKWFADNNIDVLFYDDCLTSGMHRAPTNPDDDDDFTLSKFHEDLRVSKKLAGLNKFNIWHSHIQSDGSFINGEMRLRLNNLIARRMLNDIYLYQKSFIPIGSDHIISDFFQSSTITLQAYLKTHLQKYNKRIVTIRVETGDTPAIKTSNHKDYDFELTWPSWG